MADLRFDPVSGIWVAIARKRRERPMEFVPLEQIHKQIICPFCKGNEEETPEPIVAYNEAGNELASSDDPSSWLTRIIPNKFPSLIHPASQQKSGPYGFFCSDGVQELVIPTSRHVSGIGKLTDREMELCWMACRKRVAELRSSSNTKHVMLFMNCRSAAGASLEHIHFQIMGSPLLSPFLIGRKQRNDDNLQQHGKSLVASLLEWELEQEVRILTETENFVMLCPYASRFAFQVWIVPKDQQLRFADGNGSLNSELAMLCKNYAAKLEGLIENVAYNLLVNLAPNDEIEREHWFVEIFPRLNRMAGFELGTDIWVNPVPPETAVKRLAS